MATKKLSEALAELQAAASVSGLDVRLVVAGQTDTDNAQTITLQQLLTALNVPTAQSSTQGSSKNYVYSSESDYTRCVLSRKMWLYTHTDGNLFLRFKHWGASNDTNQTNYSQVMITGYVTKNKWGLMNPYMYARLNNHNLREGQSTLDEVKVNYTRFDASGDKVLTLTKATSAKAGVMTAQDKTNLDKLTEQLNNKDNGNNNKIQITDDNSFSVCDSDGNVVLRYSDEGLDAAKVTTHLAELIGKIIGGSISLLEQKEVEENGVYFVDADMNVVASIDDKGLHSINIIEYVND